MTSFSHEISFFEYYCKGCVHWVFGVAPWRGMKYDQFPSPLKNFFWKSDDFVFFLTACIDLILYIIQDTDQISLKLSRF